MRIHTLVALQLWKINRIVLSIFHALYREFRAALMMLDLENGEKETIGGFRL